MSIGISTKPVNEVSVGNKKLIRVTDGKSIVYDRTGGGG